MMNEELRRDIAQAYGAGSWKRLTGKIWNGNKGYDLWLFEQDVEHDGQNWRCLIIERCWYDSDISTEDIDYSEDILAEAFVV